MTDQKDYTREPGVLAACGLRLQKYTDPDENYWTDDKGHCRGKRPVLTPFELWEGLCRVCRETGWFQPVLYGDAETLISGPDPMGERVFKVNEYGSLPNAVAAALHWVLQQKEG